LNRESATVPRANPDGLVVRRSDAARVEIGADRKID
jgi:hypothetical protein